MVACGLAAKGDEVEVWAPPIETDGELRDPGVVIHRLGDRFGPRALVQLSQSGAGLHGRRLVLQYVPQAFGMRGMNMPLCLWLWRRRCVDAVMFHEVAYPTRRGQPMRHNFLGAVTRIMAAIVTRASERVFVSTKAWETELRRWTLRHTSIRWLPVFSTISAVSDSEGAARARQRYLVSEGFLFGHFGTYGPMITETLETIVLTILENEPGAIMLLLGCGSIEFRERLISVHPALADRIHAVGAMAPESVSNYLSACDLMVQPYPDGITTRRTSAMAGLAHGRALITTFGDLTEPLWAESGAVKLVPAGDIYATAQASLSVAHNPELRHRLEERARLFYDRTFDLRHTIAALRDSVN